MASQPHCVATFENFYNHVMSDVIEKSTEHFLEHAVDVENLQELKTLWTNRMQECLKTTKNKRLAGRAMQQEAALEEHVQEAEQVLDEYKNEWPQEEEYQQQAVDEFPEQYANYQDQGEVKQELAWQAPACTVPVQISVVSDTPFLITVQVTPEQLQGNRIEAMLTRETLNELMYMTTVEATVRMQELVDEDLKNLMREHAMYHNDDESYYVGDQSGESDGDVNDDSGVMPDCDDGAMPAPALQVDGTEDNNMPAEQNAKCNNGGDSYSDSDEGTPDDDDDDDDDLRDILGEDDFDSEPDLDSNDDITEEEVEPEETENLILCQYTHVKRHKNLWKFRFENGIMMVDGVEYVFQRATGEGIW